MKDAVLQTTALIEENNKNIIEEYEHKLLKLEEKMSSLQEEKNRSQENYIKEKNEWE